ncbi:MAG: efflux RND transporter periplasmic adaptor subunit [Prolixibacteraceae bacterium]
MNTIIKNIKENYKLVLGVLIVGMVLGWLFFHSSTANTFSENKKESNDGHVHESEDPTIWTCSMHPQIKQDKPGQCPICAMDLIPLQSMSAEGDDVNPNELHMTESAAKLAEIQTSLVKKGVPEKELRLQGKVQADERNIAEITARFGGRIEKLFVNFTGQQVRKGEKLATIYSPDLLTAQRELLEAVSSKETRPSLYNAAKGKLKLWDLNEEQIQNIEDKGEPQTYFDILAPITGTVSMRNVSKGDYIKEGATLFKVLDLSNVWVQFDAYENDLSWIKIGDRVEFTVQAIPGKNYSAKVSFIEPFIDAKTRVAKIRVDLSNNDQLLKPEMFVTGLIQSKLTKNKNVILIPKTAVLWTGKRSIVYVKVPDRNNPTFLLREVVLGSDTGDAYVISEGLNEGEEIATNGVFKIDASAQLQGLASMMNPEGGVGSTPHDMSKMDMENSESKSSTENSGLKMKVEKNTVPEAFKKQLTAVYSTYIEMKNALVSAEPKKAVSEAQKVEQALNKVQMELLEGDAHITWMEQLKEMQKSIQAISETEKIDQQRLEFSSFNLAFYKSIKTFGLTNTETYYQFCPMANEDKGAYWLSETKDIRNPYFGDMMLKCGENRETIK